MIPRIALLALLGSGCEPREDPDTGSLPHDPVPADSGSGSNPSEPSTPPVPTDTATSSTPPPPPPSFVAEPHGGAIAVRSNVPVEVAECEPGAGWPCEDIDGDGLTDLWEDGVLDRLRPMVTFDESEPLVDDVDAVLAVVARLTPVGDRIRAYLMIGYSVDYGRCGLTGHNGDSERVALDLARLTDGGPGDVAVVGAYTAAHENTISDDSRRYDEPDLATLSFPVDPADGQPRWLVYSSDGKHASYGTLAHCESGLPIPCTDEDCAPDGVADPAPFSRLPAAFNAGEPALPRLTDLGPAGFPGEQAWVDQDFCGGRARLLCAAPVLEKLTVDPFL